MGALLVAARVLPLSAWAASVAGVAADAGVAGAIGFSVVYAIATVLLLPASVLTLTAGLAWGPWIGFAIVWPGAVVGAGLSFALSRTVFRRRAEAWLAQRPRARALDEALAAEGARLVVLLRLSPVFPFNMLNVALGVSPISAAAYGWATAVGIIPGTFLYVYLGAIGHQAGSDAPRTTGQTALFWLGLLATVAVTVLVTRRAAAALPAQLEDAPEEAPHE